MPVKFFKNYDAEEAARTVAVIPDAYGSTNYGWCKVVVRTGDTMLEVDRKDFVAFVDAFNKAAAEAVADYDRQIVTFGDVTKKVSK